MSHQEPRRELLPSRLADVSPMTAISARSERFDPVNRFDSTTYGAKGSALEWLGRAFRRHWWQILPLWALGTAALAWYLPQLLPNSYQAQSDVQVEAGAAAGAGDKDAATDFNTFKETQARRVVNPTIIARAVANDPDLAKRLAERSKVDPRVAIGGGLSASLLPNTNLIQVRMTAADDDGLAAIVDGVIQAYLALANDFNEEGNAQQILKDRNLLRIKDDEVKRKQAKVTAMVAKNGTLDASQGRDRHQGVLDQLTALSEQILRTDLDIVEQQAQIDRLKQDETSRAAAARPESLVKGDAVRAFYRLPEVIALTERLDAGRLNLARADREPGKTTEADRKALLLKNEDLQRQVDNLWAKRSPELLIAAQAEPGEKPAPESSKLEVRLNGLKARQKMLNERLDGMKRATLAGGSEVLELEFAQDDLKRAVIVLDSMTQTLHRNEVRANHPLARFRQESRAETTEKSARLARVAAGLIVPAAWFLALLGAFGLVERRTGRILDPADLPTKAQLNVIGLVPPLPKNRSLTSSGQARSQQDVERFVQSLDQLRVLVCGRGDRDGRGRRSLLITSAGENEGKSTLAAQLAERSVNAGLLTLLIDADLRNPTLSRMFDRPDSIGLANVLRGELLAEEAIGTVPEAGGFHFLPAGLVRDDLSRLLGSERLGRLLESARESFDLVLVDSPPVLPVADALTIGQWVDGAILTVRHKVSRLPLVDRASRQLASVGVTVLGAVVSGVKDRYAPYYGSRPAADPVRDDSVRAAN